MPARRLRLQSAPPRFAEGAQRVSRKFRVTPQPIAPETVERAITVATVFGRPGDFADFKHDFTGEADQVRRAADAIRALLLGRSRSAREAALQYRQLARGILGAISGSLAANISASPERLFDESSCRDRGLEHGRMTCEYIVAGLRFLVAMGHGNAVQLDAVVSEKDVQTLVLLVEAAQDLKGKPLRPICGKPLAFVQVADRKTVDSWNGFHWVKELPMLPAQASDEALAKHIASRSALGQAALAGIVHSAVCILREVAPAVVGRLAIASLTLAQPIDATLDRSKIGYPFARSYTVAGRDGVAPVSVHQLLCAKANDALAAANRLRGERFDEVRFEQAIERLVLGGFVDTPCGRQRAVDAARDAVGPYLDGLERIYASGRHRDAHGKADTDRLWFQLDDLCASFATGPLATDIDARFASAGFTARLAALRQRRG